VVAQVQTKAHFRQIMVCRNDGSRRLTPVLSLGNHTMTDFRTAEEQPPMRAPLNLVRCEDCGLVQLNHTASRDMMYRRYWYRSSVTETMRKELAGIASEVMAQSHFSPGDIVLDIGANDGFFLNAIQEQAVTIGFDPAQNVSADIDHYHHDYFSSSTYFSYHRRKPHVISSLAMFYDLDNPHQFVEDIRATLHDDGIWVCQQNYLYSMLESAAYDNIGHEHLCYYTLELLKGILEDHRLDIYDVSLNPTNGGSIRFYACHAGARTIQPSVAKLELEESMKDTASLLEEFRIKIGRERQMLIAFLMDAYTAGKRVYALGASTRGNTLLQFCGIEPPLVIAASERDPLKVGTVTPGTNIPIISEQESREAQPDYFLVLPWHFREEIIQREREFLSRGGKLVFPLPSFEIYR
jgi:hypothetical protein